MKGHELHARLTQQVGQDSAALRDIAATVTQSLAGFRPVQSPLLIGPTGSGKTTLAIALSQVLGAGKVQIIDATGLSVPGYQGGHLEEMLKKPPQVLILDEVDKCARGRGDTKLDPGGLQLQHSLLSVLDGTSAHAGSALVIGMGAFSGIDRMIFHRLGEVPPPDPLAGPGHSVDDRLLAHIGESDLVSFGYAPEFARRWRPIVMRASSMLRHLQVRKELDRYCSYFRTAGGAFDYDEEVIDFFATGSGVPAISPVLQPYVLSPTPVVLRLRVDEIGLWVQEGSLREIPLPVDARGRRGSRDLVRYSNASIEARAWWRTYEQTHDAYDVHQLALQLNWHGIKLDRFVSTLVQTKGDVQAAIRLLCASHEG